MTLHQARLSAVELIFRAFLGAGLGAGLLGCERLSSVGTGPADMVVTNASIVTMDPGQPRATALAVRDGRFIYVGDDVGAQAYVSANTQKISLNRAMLMPGINDAHQHPVEGGAKELFECSFPFTSGPNDIARAIRECVVARPDAIWIRGGQYASDFFVDHDLGSPRQWLDRYSGDKAVVLVDDSYHNAWLNSRALELLEIDSADDLPPGVTVANDSSGRPDGILVEAFGFLKDELKWTSQQYREAVAPSGKAGQWLWHHGSQGHRHRRGGTGRVQGTGKKRPGLECAYCRRHRHALRSSGRAAGCEQVCPSARPVPGGKPRYALRQDFHRWGAHRSAHRRHAGTLHPR